MNTQGITPSRIFVIVWIALLLLLLTTFGSSFVPLGNFNFVINITIAVVKALLVLIFFMNLRYSMHLMKIFAGAGFFWLMLLIGLSLVDYLTRATPPGP